MEYPNKKSEIPIRTSAFFPFLSKIAEQLRSDVQRAYESGYNNARYTSFDVARGVARGAVKVDMTLRVTGSSLKRAVRKMTASDEVLARIDDQKIKKKIKVKIRYAIDSLMRQQNFHVVFRTLQDFQKQERLSRRHFDLLKHFKRSPKTTEEKDEIFAITYRFAEHISRRLTLPTGTLAKIFSEVIASALTLDELKNSTKVIGSFEQELERLLVVLAEQFLLLSKNDQLTSSDYWESLDDDVEKRSPIAFSSQDNLDPESVTDQENAERKRLVTFFERFKSVFDVRAHLSSVLNTSDSEQEFTPELIALQKFQRKSFVLYHLRSLPQILRFLTTILQNDPELLARPLQVVSLFQEHPEKEALQKQNTLFKEGLYKLLRGIATNSTHKQVSLDWVNVLIKYLRYQSATDEIDSSMVPPHIKDLDQSRHHIISIALENLFPNISEADFEALTIEIEHLIRKTDALENILGHIRPKLIEILRRPENQPHARTLVDVILYNMYTYSSEQTRRDILRNQKIAGQQKVSASPETIESDSPKSVATFPIFENINFSRARSASSSYSLSTNSHAQLYDWAVPQGFGHVFVDNLMHYVLNADNLSHETIADILRNIFEGNTLGLLEKVFCSNSTSRTQEVAEEGAGRYNNDIFDNLVSRNPAGLLRFVSKILMQAMPPKGILPAATLKEKSKLLATQEEELTQQLFQTFLEPEEIALTQLKTLTEALADIAYGANHNNLERTRDGLEKISTFFDVIEEKLIKAQPPLYLIRDLAAQIYDIPEDLSLEQKEHEEKMRLKFAEKIIANTFSCIKSDLEGWSEKINFLCNNQAGVSSLQGLLKMSLQGVLQFGAQASFPIFLEAFDSFPQSDQALLVKRLGAAGHAIAMVSIGRYGVLIGIMAIKSLEVISNYALGQAVSFGFRAVSCTLRALTAGGENTQEAHIQTVSLSATSVNKARGDSCLSKKTNSH